MSSPAYGTRKGLYRHGLRADALVSVPRAIAAVDVATGTFTLRGHGLSAGDLVTFDAGRSSTLCAGISGSTPYLAAPVSGDLFQVTHTDGSAVVITDAGTGLISIVLDLDGAIDDSLVAWSRHIDQHLPAHQTPLELPVPEHLELWLYWLAAYDLVVARGLGNASYKDSAAALADRAKLAQAKLDEMLAKTKAVVGAVDQTPGKAENRPLGVSSGDRWGSRDGGFL